MTKSVKRTARILLIAAALTLLCVGSAFAAKAAISDFTDTNISKEAYNQILETLRNADVQNDGTVAMINTGVTANNATEGKKMAANFKDLFLGQSDFVVWYNQYGTEGANVEIKVSKGTTSYRVTTTGKENQEPTIFVAWIPGANAKASMSQHDEAMAKIKKLSKAAPKKNSAKMEYMYKWLTKNTKYDKKMASKSHSAYAAVIGKKAVCDGYSKAFNAFCFVNDIYSAKVNYVTEGTRHAVNVVKVNGTYKCIDATWGSAGTKAQSKYYMTKVSSTWAGQLSA